MRLPPTGPISYWIEKLRENIRWILQTADEDLPYEGLERYFVYSSRKEC